ADYLLCVRYHRDHEPLQSFPTRRSSDLRPSFSVHRKPDMRPFWYRNAVIYQIDPTLFRDHDGDGCGDLRGVTERLDYERGLGATDRKSTRLNSSHVKISYAVFCLKKKTS